MSVSFSVISPDRNEEVVDFLKGVFGFAGTPDHFAPPTVAWKYFAPHPWWPTGRSHALEVNGRIVAHGCVAPVRFGTGAVVVDSMRIIDWAAARSAPGAGLLLFRRCLALERGPLLTVGGSSETRQFVSQSRWFTRKAELRTYARPLWPYARFRRSSRAVRDWARLARNAYWQLRPPLPSCGGWTCRPASPQEQVFTPVGDFLPILRTRAWLDYLSACPIGACELLILEKDGMPNGHGFVSHLSGSARVADFALAGHPAMADRINAFAALIHYVKDQRRSVELVTASSLDDNCLAFEACGLHFRRSSPVAAADPLKMLAREIPLETNLMLGDAFYLHDPGHPFWT